MKIPDRRRLGSEQRGLAVVGWLWHGRPTGFSRLQPERYRARSPIRTAITCAATVPELASVPAKHIRPARGGAGRSSGRGGGVVLGLDRTSRLDRRARVGPRADSWPWRAPTSAEGAVRRARLCDAARGPHERARRSAAVTTVATAATPPGPRPRTAGRGSGDLPLPCARLLCRRAASGPARRPLRRCCSTSPRSSSMPTQPVRGLAGSDTRATISARSCARRGSTPPELVATRNRTPRSSGTLRPAQDVAKERHHVGHLLRPARRRGRELEPRLARDPAGRAWKSPAAGAGRSPLETGGRPRKRMASTSASSGFVVRTQRSAAGRRWARRPARPGNGHALQPERELRADVVRAPRTGRRPRPRSSCRRNGTSLQADFRRRHLRRSASWDSKEPHAGWKGRE